LIAFSGTTSQIQIGCNIHQLPQLVNVSVPLKAGVAAAHFGQRRAQDPVTDRLGY
jgi:hypothetical protein